jgi:hypothetical protein
VVVNLGLSYERENINFTALENIGLKGIFGPERQKIMYGWRKKLHSEKCH